MNATSLQYITLEEHYASKSLLPYQTDPVDGLLVEASRGSSSPGLRDINDARLNSMNENNIRIQVISNNPNPPALSQPSAVTSANNELLTAISTHPSRYRGFCFLPMAYPTLASQELRRCITKLGFVGALTDSHLPDNTFYDSPAYDILWSTLSELDVPFYLHPTYPRIEDVNGTGGRYTPNSNDYSELVASVLATAGWGWHSDTAVAFLRMWLAGVFDRYPRLKIVLGHMGEMLPYMLARVNAVLGKAKTEGKGVRETWDSNVWVTTSGMFSLEPMATLLKATARDRIMYSVDYPFSSNEHGARFMADLRNSSMVNQKDWEAIAFGNAAKLLKLS